MYTPIIQPADLKTHIYAEIITEITRADSTIVTKAIDAGINEVKIYLERYDKVQLFGDANLDSAATINDEFLRDLCKDVIMWKLIKLANPNVDSGHIRQSYEDALETLKRIQKGVAAPPGWPYLDTTGDAATPPGNYITIQANPKRTNDY